MAMKLKILVGWMVILFGLSTQTWSQVDDATQPVDPEAVEQLATAAPEAESQTTLAIEAERQARVRTEQVQANLSAVKEILNIGLSNDEAGELLREARRRAPDVVETARRVMSREREVAEARLDRVRLLERRRLAEDLGEVNRLSEELSKQDAYLTALENALAAERVLASETTQLVNLLDGRLLWIGSAPPIGAGWVAEVAKGGLWITNAQGWANAGSTLLHRFADTPFISLLVLILIIILTIARFRLADSFSILAEPVGKYATDSFLHTARAFALTVLMTLPLPLAGACAGGLILTQNADPFAHSIGKGLVTASAVFLLLNFFRQMCRHQGLADVHFGWDESARLTLLRNLRWLLPIETITAFVVAMCDASGREIYRQGIGRLAFLVGSIGLTLFVARVLKPGSGVFSALMSRKGLGWRFRKIWYGLLVLLPAALTIAAAVGYYYTATEVQGRFFSSGVVVLGAIVLYSLTTRWLLVTRRRAAIQQARKQLAERREARVKKDAAEAAGEVAGEAQPELEVQTVDIAAASEQTLALLRTIAFVGALAALWAVWKDLLPALTALHRIELVSPTLDATGSVLIEPVTLWSLLLGLLALIFTIIAARNFPAMLELIVLERFSIDPGVRFAIITLTRYAVVAIGIIIASKLFGIDWSRAQWIIAALGVGLGFGLQEIVANFVSGLIILFERPVRVGDTVTVGEVSGTVTRLQIRATTITDWDNKEVLVPNKSFITERVINWTLSNTITRLLIPVGVAYGTDIGKAHKTIAEAVKKVPSVLDDPMPSVHFVGFGESSLDFEVRAFVGEIARRLTTLHELHSSINAALSAEKIEIPFPQRDLHLRTHVTIDRPANSARSGKEESSS